MDASDLLGWLAATLTTAAFVPQAWRTFRTRDVSGISLRMYGMFTLGVALWLAYGIVLRDAPMIVANSLGLLLAASVLVMKLRYGRRADAQPPAGDRRASPTR